MVKDERNEADGFFSAAYLFYLLRLLKRGWMQGSRSHEP